MIRINLRNAQATLQRTALALQGLPKEARSALRRASGRALQAVKAEALRAGREAYENPLPTIQAYSRVAISTQGSLGMGGELHMRGPRGVSQYRFKPLPNIPGTRPPEGVSVKIRKDGQRKVYGLPGHSKPFIMRKKQGGNGIFVRDGRKFRMLYGPSPMQAVKRADNRERLQEKAEDVFERRLNHELQTIVNGLVGRRR